MVSCLLRERGNKNLHTNIFKCYNVVEKGGELDVQKTE